MTSPRPILDYRGFGQRDPLTLIDLYAVIVRVQSEYQDIAVVDTVEAGRSLFLDGYAQSTALDEHIYHEYLIHPAMTLNPEAQQVLVLGAGEGASLRELLRYPQVDRIDALDIDAQLVDIVKRHLPEWHCGAFDDPRVQLQIADVRDRVLELPADSYDLVVVDLSDPQEAGSAISVLDSDFFEHVARIMRPQAVMVMQVGELHEQVAEATAAQMQVLRESFDHLRVGGIRMPSFDCDWGFAFASKRAFAPKTTLSAPVVGDLRAFEPAADAFWISLDGDRARRLGLSTR